MHDILSFHTQLGADGRVVIPAQVRRELKLKPGDTLVAEFDGHSMLLRSYAETLKETQEYFRQFVPPGASVVDEFLADRRAEAREDDEDAARAVGTPAP